MYCHIRIGRLQDTAVPSSVRQSLLGNEKPLFTAFYSHGEYLCYSWLRDVPHPVRLWDMERVPVDMDMGKCTTMIASLILLV